MFGLSFEKILVAGIIAVIVIGPRRLPYYAQRLGELVRLLKTHLDSLKSQAAETMGTGDWESLDPRQYDPRRIIREALSEPGEGSQTSTSSSAGKDTTISETNDPAEAAPRVSVTGSSGHPRRRIVAPAAVAPAASEHEVEDEGQRPSDQAVGAQV